MMKAESSTLRNTMHKLAIGTVVSVATVLALTGCAGQPTSQPSASKDSETKTVEFEWIATSAAGIISGAPEDFTLEMSGLNPEVVQYAERPARFFDTITLKDLVNSPGLWVASDPPNAVLTFYTSDSNQAPETLPVVLSAPNWDEASGKLTFHGKVLSEREKLPSNISAVTAAIDGTVTQYGAVGMAVTYNTVLSTTAATVMFSTTEGIPCASVTLTPGKVNLLQVMSPGCNMVGRVILTYSSPTSYTLTYSGSVSDGRSGTTSGNWLVGNLQ
ncbi:hypothetical protein [Aurantimicrobium minutum]|uniref:hypothetical protein n=1 Tax=Aurantimicrobium minutum TaxID=708131 RepID=UPI00247306AF|nr:hypothetical protein [Aurantimicrobium minutum]MDH6423384.1 hypothetical protein [Aurantimicrobium minutum]